MKPLLTVQNLCFAYGDQAVLQEVSLTMAAGEVVGLLGPNGSGKSTLIRSLIGHLPATGAIQWESRPLKDWRRRDLARRLAYLPQSPAWDPEDRVIDALRLGRAPYLDAFGLESSQDAVVVDQIARQLDLTDFLARPLSDLSGGQRQRVFLGRCLVQEPATLLLDEPNTYLDLRHQVELTRQLRALAREKGIAVLMASHDLNLAGAYADRLLILHHGRLMAEGTPDAVLDAKLLSEIYGVNLERIDRPNRPPLIVPMQ